MKKILLAAVITFIFILYLFQHRYSLKCTQDIAKLEKTRQLLKEEIIALQSEKAKIFLFTNLADTAEKLNLVFPTIFSKSEFLNPKSETISKH